MSVYAQLLLQISRTPLNPQIELFADLSGLWTWNDFYEKMTKIKKW